MVTTSPPKSQEEIEQLPHDHVAVLDAALQTIPSQEAVVSNTITIDPEFEKLLTPLREDESAGLRESIARDGCHDPLKLWGSILIDGHNRYRICTELGKSYKTVSIELADRHAAENWIIDNQLGRRNVTPQMASYLRGRKYLVEKADKLENLKQNRPMGQNVPSEERTSAKVASHFNVDEKTIRRDAEFAEAVDKAPIEVRTAILSGKSSATKLDVVEAAKQNDFSQIASSSAKSPTKPKPKCKPTAAQEDSDYAKKLITQVNSVMREVCELGCDEAIRLARGWGGGSLRKMLAERLDEFSTALKREKTTGSDAGNGVYLAHEAINRLIRIPKDDSLRSRGMEIVADFIESNSDLKPATQSKVRELANTALQMASKPFLEVSTIELRIVLKELVAKMNPTKPKESKK